MTPFATSQTTFPAIWNLLPAELIYQIVESLDDQLDEWNGVGNFDIKSLSTVCRAFVPFCQRILFRNIQLQPAVIYDSKTQMYKGLDYTSLYSKLVARRPHLATYVRALEYRLPREIPCVENNATISALERMRNIIDFKLVLDAYNPRGSWRGCGNCLMYEAELEVLGDAHTENHPRHANALRAIIDNPVLEHLRLVNANVSSRILHGRSTALTTLEMENSEFLQTHFAPHWLYEPNLAQLSRPMRLRALRFSAADSWGLHKVVQNNSAYSHFRVSLAKLESLTIIKNTLSHHDPNAECHVLARTEALIDLTLEDTSTLLTCEETQGVHELPLSPLHRLHPGSFETLTELTIKKILDVGFEGESIVHREPYYGLLAKTGTGVSLLSRFTALRALRIETWIRGNVAVRFAPGFDGRWGQLDGILAPCSSTSSPFPHLDFVEVAIGVILEESEHLNGLLAIQDGFFHYINRNIFNRNQFPRLIQLKMAGEIELRLASYWEHGDERAQINVPEWKNYA